MNDEFLDTFLAEANELIVDLEKSLLLLENDKQNEEAISSTFRAMHTLKGGAGMFGYEAIGTITHHLESIYEDIRDGKRELTEPILRATFRTLDHLRVLLQYRSSLPTDVAVSHEELLDIIKKQNNQAQTIIKENIAAEIVSESTYYIKALPKPGIFKSGTNPLYLIDDLLVLGQGVSLPHFQDLPSFENIEHDVCYTGFEVLLKTSKNEAAIREVFLFAENHCTLDIQKIGNGNLLADLSTGSNPWLNRQFSQPIGLDTIQNTIANKTNKKSNVESIRKAFHKSNNIRVNSDQLDDLMNLVSELVTTQARLALYSNNNTSPELMGISENIEKITRRLRDNAFTMSLVPLESVVVRFQRLVSDLSKELNKEIEFKAEGMETKIDKSIIEKLVDPLLHLLRNSIDHGIENPEDRIKKGKSSTGSVRLKSYYSGASVVLEVIDDGAGIRLDKVKEKAIEKGLIEQHSQLSDKELLDLIFMPGFSTATKLTGVSGRGVGMDVVKRNITDIRGDISINTSLDKGTTFIITLPLTLSILDGLLVNIGGTSFVVPLSAVGKCYEVETKTLESSFNQWITLEGKRTPFIFLRQEFSISQNKPTLSQIIKVPFEETHVGLVVDKIEGEYQAVLKPLGHYYEDQDEFSGATILGNGTVALVLDSNKLIRKLTINNNN